MGEYQVWQWGTQRGLEPLNTMGSHRAVDPHPSFYTGEVEWYPHNTSVPTRPTIAPRGDPLIDGRPYRHNTPQYSSVPLWLHLPSPILLYGHFALLLFYPVTKRLPWSKPWKGFFFQMWRNVYKTALTRQNLKMCFPCNILLGAIWSFSFVIRY